MVHYSRWRAPLLWSFAILLFHGLGPWAISLLSIRHGWSNGNPGAWNFAGLIAVGAGVLVLGLAFREHLVRAPEGWDFEGHLDRPAGMFTALPYIIVSGPYRYSRNPIYLGGIVVWAGWTIFYGSAALTIASALLWFELELLQIPLEERRMLEQFDGSYVMYKRKVSRWFCGLL